jgi:hypothetical protein
MRVLMLSQALNAVLAAGASLPTRRAVVRQAILAESNRPRPTGRPAVLPASDLCAIFKAEAKRERKAAARLARGH